MLNAALFIRSIDSEMYIYIHNTTAVFSYIFHKNVNVIFYEKKYFSLASHLNICCVKCNVLCKTFQAQNVIRTSYSDIIFSLIFQTFYACYS